MNEDLRFDADTHTYYYKGAVIPSVTQIMKPLSAAVYKGIDEDVLSKAAAKGTDVHAAVEMFLKYGLDDDVSPENKPYFDAFMKWFREHNKRNNFVLEDSEKMYCHVPLLYAGTVDIIAKIDGAVTLVDVKTTASINHMLTSVQLEAYRRMVEHNGISIDRTAILQLKKDGSFTYETWNYPDYDAWKTFMALKDIRDHIIKYGGEP